MIKENIRRLGHRRRGTNYFQNINILESQKELNSPDADQKV
jgi:hypothetical protein